MKTKTKAFDCVAMKRAGAAEVYRKARGMTFQKQVEFWNRATEALLREQQAAIARTKAVRRGK
ncbi:MAG: hypothetical protein NTV86_12775 [Planctomycetota bacterium]|nr:hypothetical protein [Planctomycetota bacterium]